MTGRTGIMTLLEQYQKNRNWYEKKRKEAFDKGWDRLANLYSDYIEELNIKIHDISYFSFDEFGNYVD